MKCISSQKIFDGYLKRFRHHSQETKTDMVFSIFHPPQMNNQKSPTLYWLSGLTCTDENFCQKAGAFRLASQLGLCIVIPDTSPRGLDLPNEHTNYEFGSGASFYVDSTVKPWSNHYRMYSYVNNELPTLIQNNFNVSSKKSIAGHSMGGHGALIIALKNNLNYQSVSAFSPIVNPVNAPWGKKAFSNYLGKNEESWLQYDACYLISQVKKKIPILIDQGLSDEFFNEQLKGHSFIESAENNQYKINFNFHKGYDHSYYFISSFIDSHLKFHHQFLGI